MHRSTPPRSYGAAFIKLSIKPPPGPNLRTEYCWLHKQKSAGGLIFQPA